MRSIDRRFQVRFGVFCTPKFAVLLVCVGVALTLGVAALFAASAPSFAAARSYETGRGPVSVALGDLNGDGKPDLATANAAAPPTGGSTVSVLVNEGVGSFQARRVYPTGLEPESVAIGDLNGDGKPDLATANDLGETVSVLLNRGNGSFRLKHDYATGDHPSSVAIGDLNGDGKADLVTANIVAFTVSVLLNRGDGSFQAKLDYETGRAPGSLAIGDLNGDGKPDLATASVAGDGTNTISVLANKGDGSFEAKVDYATGNGPSSVAIGDLNGDHKPDLVTANGANAANTVSVLANRGDGSFQARLDYPTGRSPISVAIGDLNGDGKPDLATTNHEEASTVSVLVNRGDGSFQANLDYRTGRFPESVAIGDLNGDGQADLATANAAVKTVSVFINTPGLCTVQNVRGKTLVAAKRTIARANCRVGKIRRAYSRTVKKGRVISEKPKPGTVRPGGGKVNLVVSSGRKPS
jgi:hypothetical protein